MIFGGSLSFIAGLALGVLLAAGIAYTVANYRFERDGKLVHRVRLENFRRVRKLFWIWQDDQLEEWLASMSVSGWHLVGTSYIGLSFYFVKGETQNYTYRLDYRSGSNTDLQEYVHLFEESGWTYIGQDCVWKYFRHGFTDGDQPEIYTDSESKAARNQRIIGLLAGIAGLNAFFFAYNGFRWSGLILAPQSTGELLHCISFLNLLVALLLVYGIFRIWKRNRLLLHRL